MRLGIDAWGLSSDGLYSGVGQYASQLLRYLPVYAPEIRITAYAGANEARPEWLPHQVDWRPLQTHVPRKLTALYSRLYLLPRQARADGLDLFHAPAVHVRPSLPPVPRLPCPVVATLHDLIPISYYDLRRLPLRQRIFYRWCLRRVFTSAALITVSQHSAQEIRQYAPRSLPPLAVIPNAVEFAPNTDPGTLDRLGISQPYILYAGSYEPRKNLAGALSAYAILAARGTAHRLVAIVERESGHAAAIEAQVEALELRDRVRFVYNLPDADLRTLYTHARLLLFTSLAEGFGWPPLQAAACGTPVVASDLDVIHENLQDAALYVDPSDVLAMSNAIDRVLHDRALRRQLRHAGPAQAARFPLPPWISRHVAVYDAALNRQRVAVS